MGRRYHGEYEDRETFTPWETCSDLYCGLLLVFVLLFFFAIYQYIDARERNNAETAELQSSLKEEQATVLALYKADLEDQEAAYQEKSRQLDSQKTALAIMQSDLDERTELLNEQEELIRSQEKQMDEQQRTMDEQKSLIREQQAMLDSQAAQIEQIVGIRGQLIDELNTELSASQIQIQADKLTGAIAFSSTVLFAKDDDELTDEGKAFFRRFMPVYMEVLLQEKFREHIAEIIIEGHTDDSGSYLHNLELSQQRAGSVAEYILDDSCDFLDADTIAALKSLVTVNGCADRDLIYQKDGNVDADRSRRVELKFRLKDQEMIQEMDEILKKKN